MAKEFEADSGLEGDIFKHQPYALNSYFEKIYIYEKIDDQSDVLYQADWIYAIELQKKSGSKGSRFLFYVLSSKIRF